MSAPRTMSELRADLKETEDLNGRLVSLLHGVANGLKGPPPPHMLHDWSDLPYTARVLRKRMERCTCGAARTPTTKKLVTP